MTLEDKEVFRYISDSFGRDVAKVCGKTLYKRCNSEWTPLNLGLLLYAYHVGAKTPPILATYLLKKPPRNDAFEKCMYEAQQIIEIGRLRVADAT